MSTSASRRRSVLAGAIPLVTAAELLALVAVAPTPGVAIARARDAGTNALLVTPSDAKGPMFGAPRSSEVHAAAADAANLPFGVLDIAGLALDVDTVEDARDAGVLFAISGTSRGRDGG